MNGVLQDIVVHCEGVLERAQVLDQQTADLVWLEEPLVGIEPNRVGALDTAQQRLAGLGDDGKAAVHPARTAQGDQGRT